MGEQGGDAVGATSIGRRSLIKKVGAAGVVAWTAPVITASRAAAQASGTLQANECFKYQFNWWWSGSGATSPAPDLGTAADAPHNLMRQYDVQVSPAATWHEECQPSDDDGVHLAGKTNEPAANNKGYFSNSASVNGSCCKMQYDWWENNAAGAERIPTFPSPSCITISPACNLASSGDGFANGESITFTLDSACGNCYFLDPFFAYKAASAAPNSNITQQAPGSTRGRSVKVNFTGSHARLPVYLKVWIACGPVGSPVINYVTRCQETTPIVLNAS